MTNTTISAKCKIDVEGLQKMDKLVEELRRHLNSASSIIGQINSTQVNVSIEYPTSKVKK